MGINSLIKKIRKRENRFYNFLYLAMKHFKRIELPYIPILHDVLYYERILRINIWRSFWRVFYYQPLFKSRCASCGKNMHIYNSGQGMPVIIGDLQINLGNNVRIYDRSTLAALTVGKSPILKIGDNTNISRSIVMHIGNEVEIGKDCMIGCHFIADNPGHNVDLDSRQNKLNPDTIGKIKIGDCVFAGIDSVILGNVEIGYGSFIAARAVVTKSVPPMTIVAGVPAKVIGQVGEEALDSTNNA